MVCRLISCSHPDYIGNRDIKYKGETIVARRISSRWLYSENFLPVPQDRIFSGLAVKIETFAFFKLLPTFCKMSADNTSPQERETFF
jgi:hypothetical protein